jgi:hypothetical protein
MRHTPQELQDIQGFVVVVDYNIRNPCKIGDVLPAFYRDDRDYAGIVVNSTAVEGPMVVFGTATLEDFNNQQQLNGDPAWLNPAGYPLFKVRAE